VVENASFNFADDFEGEEDDAFWGGSSRGSAYAYHGKPDATDSSNKILALEYQLQFDGQHAWSQKDFHVPQATELAFLYRLYTPANYVNTEGNRNHKLLVTWSGPYGVISEGLHISTSMWNSADGSGKIPSMNIGVNPINTSGDDRGHAIRRDEHQQLAAKWQDGQWHTMYIYMKAAPAEGEYGAFEIWRDGEKILSTDDDPAHLKGSWWLEAGGDPAKLIEYARGYNYIDSGYFMGWWNDAQLREDVVFQMDDLTVWANSAEN
jgi:hypothetical protein